MDIIEGNYQALLEQNKQLQAELALKNKMIEEMAFTITDHTFTNFNSKEIINKYKLLANKKLTNASI